MWEKKAPTTLGGQRAAQAVSGLPKDIASALKKARRLGAGEALEWADASLATIGRNISDHRREPGTGDFLRAALSDAAALYAVLTAAVEVQPNLGRPGGPPAVSAALGVAAFRQG